MPHATGLQNILINILWMLNVFATGTHKNVKELYIYIKKTNIHN